MVATAVPLRIGILALQGGVSEHAKMLSCVGATGIEVRLPRHLANLDGIILPGGESTTIGKLMIEGGLLEPLRDRILGGLPTYGTCAGMILLAREVVESAQPLLGVMDIRVRRNAFGAQVNSFEADLRIAELGQDSVRAVFIRAPVVEQAGPRVEVLATLENGTPVAVREGTLLASAFHPELGDDARMHRLFVRMCHRSDVGRTLHGIDASSVLLKDRKE